MKQADSSSSSSFSVGSVARWRAPGPQGGHEKQQDNRMDDSNTCARDQHAAIPWDWKPLKWNRYETNTTTPFPFEDHTFPRKKQRLGWGQGLAKYEKHKVEVASPRTDDRLHISATSNDVDACDLSGDHEFQRCLEEFSANLEYLNRATNLSSLLSDMLQIEDASSTDSNFVKSTAISKLLLVKTELSKALEKTECEIDLYENELKILSSENKCSAHDLVAFGSLEVEYTTRFFLNLTTASGVIQKPVPLQLILPSDIHTDIPNLRNVVLEEDHGDVKDDESLCMEKALSAYGVGDCETHSADVSVTPASFEKPWCMPSILQEKAASVADDDDQNDGICTCIPSDLNLECNMKKPILIAKKNSAGQAFEELCKLLPTIQPESDLWGSCNISCQKNICLVKERLATRKCSKRFKERVLTLKLRALQHLWKEDLRLLSIRKYKAKSQKRVESNSRTPPIVYRKHQSSNRSRFTSPGSLTLVPTSEIVDFSSKLLSDSQVKLCRDSLKMPSLVDEKEKSRLRFISDNSLVEDPCVTEKERVMINPWSPMEKEVFLEKFETFGKNFKKIASYFDHKTTADCVEFYYKNHKSESFEKIKKSQLKKQDRGIPTSTYLMTSGKKWNCEVNAASLVLLGEASVIAADADDYLKSQHTYLSRPFHGRQYNDKTRWGDDASHEKLSTVDIVGNGREATGTDALAGICGPLSSEAMSSCVTSSMNPAESCQEGKFQRSFVMDGSLTPKFMQCVDDEETCSDESCEEMDSADWTDKEKFNFVTALRSYGKDFVKIALCVRTRSKDQCKAFFSKARKSLDLDGVHLGTCREGTPTSDANGGRSDTEDACVYEMESALCSTRSCSKLDNDCPISVNCETSDHAATNHLLSWELAKLKGDNGNERFNQMQSDELEISGENSGTQTMYGDSVTVGEASSQADIELDHKSKLNTCGEDGSMCKEAREDLDGSSEMMHLELDSVSNCDGLVTLNVGSTQSTEGVKYRQISIDDESPSADVSRRDNDPTTSEAVENESIPTASAQAFTSEAGPEQTIVSEDGEEHVPDRMAILDDGSRSRSSRVDVDRMNTNHKSLYQAATGSSQQGISLTGSSMRQISLELIQSVENAQSLSWKHSEDPSVPGPLIQYENHIRQGPSLSTLDYKGKRREHQKPEYPDVNQQYLIHQRPLNQAEPSRILRGYPLQVLNKKEANGHADHMNNERQSVSNTSTANGKFQPGQFIMQDFRLEKCKGSKLPWSLAELPFLPKNHEQPSHSQGSSYVDNSGRVGDVKLFGKILSHPSSSQRPKPVSQETDGKVASISKTFDLKLSHQGTDRALMRANRDDNMYLGIKDFPARSYGFWDGSRIQTRFSALAGSPALLTKYPAGFGDHAAAAVSYVQQYPTMIKRNDWIPNPLSVYSVQNASSSNMLLPVYRGGNEGAKLQPFALDMKRQDDACSFQQPRGGVVGMNVMGAGVVSDPVAAIKLHYATASDRYSRTQSGSSIGREKIPGEEET